MAHAKSPVGRVAYPTLMVARKQSDTAKPKFSITIVWPAGTNLDVLTKNIADATAKAYPNGAPNRFRNPLRSGADKRRDDGTMTPGFKEDDTWAEFWRYETDKNGVLNVKAPLVDYARNPIPASDLYAGCTARVLFNAFTYNRDGNKGVSLGLEAVQKHEDGEKIGAPPVDASTAFDDLAAPTTEELPF